MRFCDIQEDGTLCDCCGSCGMVLCRESSNVECNDCGYCEYGGITLD